jgi:ribosomal protein L24
MPKLKIKKGDNVVVISGRDKGKAGEVLRVYPAEARAIVQGVHIARRHSKQADPGRIQIPRRRPQGPLRAPLGRDARQVRESE